MSLPLFTDPDESYVDVAVPVPLRQLFTYRLPRALRERVVTGSRVAVPFANRKLFGFVMGAADGPPEGVDKILPVAGLLEPEPVFPEELLTFLLAAADYYMHPVGEVLRAAAPALPSDALKRLEKDGFLSDRETLPGARIATRTVTMVRPTDVEPTKHLGERQRAVLALLAERGEVTTAELRAHVKSPTQVVESLGKRGLVTTERLEVVADPYFHAPVQPDVPPEPNEAQRVAIERMIAALREPDPGAFLLHGVTGSGKTEVYLRVIAEARERGQGALLLVPEIALTPQLVARFRARFGDGIAVLHSGLTDRERHDAWRALRRGGVTLAIGARSALFAPVPDLGVIVVDEEHDPSFKQEEGFRYNARDMAMLRAKRAGALCVLGSATPAVETYHLSERGRVERIDLPDRATAQRLPSVEIVDLTRHRSGPSGHPLLSAPLHRALDQCLAAEGQAILFLNRRGFAPSVRCKACGQVVECPACSVALTEHRRAAVLRCHYCDFATPPGETCTACGSPDLDRIGLGTEKLEDTLAEVFAPARVARLDRDVASGVGVEAVLERLRAREIDILVGTQMVTKGHDIPGVTLVGVVLADQSLAFPDFRAAERTYQLLSQVAGRSGRGEVPGKVVFQTFQPEHPAVVQAAQHDYHSFYRAEIHARRELEYVPFSRLVAVRIDAGDDRRAATPPAPWPPSPTTTQRPARVRSASWARPPPPSPGCAAATATGSCSAAPTAPPCAPWPPPWPPASTRAWPPPGPPSTSTPSPCSETNGDRPLSFHDWVKQMGSVPICFAGRSCHSAGPAARHMEGVSDGGRLALDIYDLLRETDPARWREDVETRVRDRLARVKTRTAELLGRVTRTTAAAPLADPVRHVATVLDHHVPPPDLTGHDLRQAWMRFRERMVPAYEALARVLRAHRVSAPPLRPTNWYRSAFHVVSAFGVILLFELVLTEQTTIYAAGGFALVCWLLETGRALSGRMNARLMEVRFFQLIIHPHEHHRVNSATWYASALIVLALASPGYASVAGVAVLGAGDPMAAFVGRRWGKVSLVHGRTLEGSLAFVLFGALSAFVVLLFWHPIAGWPALAVVSLAAAVAGALVELVSVQLDDNFTIPLAGAAAAVATAAALGL